MTLPVEMIHHDSSCEFVTRTDGGLCDCEADKRACEFAAKVLRWEADKYGSSCCNDTRAESDWCLACLTAHALRKSADELDGGPGSDGPTLNEIYLQANDGKVRAFFQCSQCKYPFLMFPQAMDHIEKPCTAQPKDWGYIEVPRPPSETVRS